MGLSGFYQLLKKQYTPEMVNQDSLQGKTVALDGDFVLYQALHGYTRGEDVTPQEVASHIVKWLTKARLVGIQTIFVTTGGEAPAEKKDHCHQARKRKRQAQEANIQALEATLSSRVLDKGDELVLREKVARMKDQVRRVDSAMSTAVVAILETSGFTCRSAVSEADFMLVMMSEDGTCDYVATDDSDIIVAGATKVLRGFVKLLTSNVDARVYDRSDILKCLQLTSPQLLELGCLLACDYQPKITNLGPVGALAVLLEFGDIASFLASEKFNTVLKNKKRKFSLPDEMDTAAYIRCSRRSVDIFLSRPDR